jgi:peptidoglycan/LPS O-acetylase OafA/YrhL
MSQAEMTVPTPHLTQPKYRPDIDGLRAIAVLAVVAFHAFPSLLKGGFIGVDVFFVISGFLISTIIFENFERNTFSFAEFYARRIKRIFPALIVVLIFCVIFGWFSLLPEELNQLGKHVLAGAGFVANFVLWSESGYFDNLAETKPLLHLWSLGIEEQFYIFWPFLIWTAWKRQINILLVILSLFVVSFMLNICLIHTSPVSTFYSPITRFWELLCGSLLAYHSILKAKKPYNNSYFFIKIESLAAQFQFKIDAKIFISNVFSFVGMLFLISGVYLINKDLAFPGYFALIPALGSTMIIMAGSQAWINRRVLSNKILVWFGLISFPLYLWHWPLLSFGRILYFDTPPLNYRVIAVLLSIVLAWLTMKFVEAPLRYGIHKYSLKFYGLSASLFFIAFLGAIISNYNFQSTHSFDKLIFKRKGEHAIGSSLYWYEGKDGWLFLGNSYDDTVAKLKLAKIPTQQSLNDVEAAFAKVSEAAARNGIKFSLIVGPNKSSIYPEYLPDGINPSDIRYSSFFLTQLRGISGLTIYDPTNDLLLAKDKEGLLYWKTDTHWNNKGAFLAFTGFSKLLNLPPPNVSFKQGETHSGDLIGISKLKNFPLDPQDNWEVVWKDNPIWIEKEIPNEQKTTFGHATLVSNDKPISDQYVWVVGDSFASALKQYFNVTFSKVRYVGHWGQKLTTLPDEIDKAEKKPDLIVVVRVERSF